MYQEPTELHWVGCFDRIFLDPKIQIRYIDTENQLADILTKGDFTRDEWNNLLHSSTSSDLEKLKAAVKPASRTRRNSRPYEAPSSQVKLKDVYLGGLMDDSAEKLVATEENQVVWEFLNLNPGAFMRMR